MFRSRKSNVKSRPAELGMLNNSIGLAIWTPQNGSQESLDLRVGPAFQPNGGSLIVKSTFPAFLYPEMLDGLRACGELLGNNPTLLPDDIREMLRTYAAAIDTALNEVKSSLPPFSNGSSGAGIGVF